jgi:hypothetical protein
MADVLVERVDVFLKEKRVELKFETGIVISYPLVPEVQIGVWDGRDEVRKEN